MALTRTRRTTRRRSALVGLALLAACATPPPAVAPPSLPSTVGVAWLRDIGGTLNGDGDAYLAEFRRWTLLNKVLSGPDVPTTAAPPATIADMGWVNNVSSRPDGTALQPWNGFAGEGISLDPTAFAADEWRLTFPGGSCSLGEVNAFSYITMVSPSPDGSVAAVLWHEDGPVSHVTTYSLANSTNCSPTNSLTYGSPNGPTGNVFVWSPDSTAVLYAVAAGSDHRLVRLDVDTGVTTEVVAATPKRLLPLGWSSAGRLLYRTSEELPDGRRRTTLLTRAITGGPTRTVDTSTGPVGWIDPQAATSLWHVGYYVPGTTTIVYVDGSATTTSSDGLTFPRFDIRLIADASNATARSIHGTPLPVSWHPLPAWDAPTPMGPTTPGPNVEFIERFVH